jgi:hypothetical protein
MRINFDSKFFQKRNFDKKSVDKYFNNASKDFRIAFKNEDEEVIFKFSYDCLIKIGIALIASRGFRVKSRQGHHVKIIEKLSEILEDRNIILVGESMRKKRNFDLYAGGILITEKEAKSYLELVGGVIKKAEEYLKSQKSLL